MNQLHGMNEASTYTIIYLDTGGSRRIQICDWIDETCEGEWFLFHNSVYFKNSKEATLFKLKFG